MNDNTINDDMTMGGATATLLAGRYRVVRQLGQGGMGSVWLAEDTKLDGFKVAIKMLPSVLVNNKRAYAQVKAEALVSLKLSHPNIATVRAFEEEGGNPFLVMDYIDGQTLNDYLAEKGKLSEEETVRLLKPVAAALDYAHSQGVVHRDVKPGNVMIRKDGTPFVLDFGIAREIQETMTRVTGKLSSGTLLYMSPEQLNGDAPKPAQDVYSFAAMAYECLKGEPPFVRGGIEDQIKNKKPEPLGPQSANCGQGVMAGLAKSPESRPETCVMVLSAGVRVPRDLAGDSVTVGKTRIVPFLLVALALISVLGGGWWIWKVQEDDKSAHCAGMTVGGPAVVTQVAEKPVVGVMTSLQGVLGEPEGMQEGLSSSKGWTAFAELAKHYEVRPVAAYVTKIDPDVKVLVVLHAKDLPDTALFAIDQFVLRGGKLIACVDPFSIKDMIASRQKQNPMMQMGDGQDGPSTLGKLFDAWGVKFDMAKISCDLEAATKLNNGQGGVDDNPAFLSLGANNMDKGDPLVQSLTQVMFPFAGAFVFEKNGMDLTFRPVITTSRSNSCAVDKMSVQFGVKNMVPDGHERVLAARLAGTFKTAFPKGPDVTNDVFKVLSEGMSSVILFADSDFVADDFCVQKKETPFGNTTQLINDNLSLFSNAIALLAGREELIGARFREASGSSLDAVRALEAEAMKKWQGLQAELEAERKKTEQRLATLQKQKGDRERVVLLKEQQEEIVSFRKVQTEIRKKMKSVQDALRADVVCAALKVAKNNRNAGCWQDCRVAAEKVLSLDPENADALLLMKEAVHHLDSKVATAKATAGGDGVWENE